MNNLIFAIKAFWTILTDKPHVYCNITEHSMIGKASEVEDCISLLVATYNQTIEQENLLEEANKLIDK